MYKIENLPSRLEFGNQGENLVTEIKIDCAAWLDEYPGATVAATVILPGYGAPAPLPVEMDGTVMTITVTRSMTAKAGRGSINLRVLGANDEEKRSAVVETHVRASRPPAEGEMPDPVQDWTNAANSKLAELNAVNPQTLSFDKATCVLSITGGNSVQLNRGLSEAQYQVLTDVQAKPNGMWTLITGPVYSQPTPSRDIPDRKYCLSDYGTGIVHLDFYAAATSGVVGTIPDDGPKAKRLSEFQVFDGGTVWLDAGSRIVKAQGLTINKRYLFNIIVSCVY